MATKEKLVLKNRVKDDLTVGSAGSNGDGQTIRKELYIPKLNQGYAELWIEGDSPLLCNNKLNVAEEVAAIYDSSKGHTIKKEKATPEEQYARAFYVMPSSKHPAPHPKGRYGVPTSGIKKCICSGIRQTGISDNTTVGLLQKAIKVLADDGGLSEIHFDRLEHDIRPVNIGSGTKTVPQMRHRPAFYGWKIKLLIKYNRMLISEEQLLNIIEHAGQYVGLCEMRAEKKQGECGGFTLGEGVA